jgi:hypothetical protein
LNEIFKTIDDTRFNGIKQKKTPKNFSLFGYHPAKDNKKDNCEMASKIGEPGEDLI